MSDGYSRCREAVQRGEPSPHALVVVGYPSAIDVEKTGELRREVLRDGDGWHGRTEHNVDILEQRLPARLMMSLALVPLKVTLDMVDPQ